MPQTRWLPAILLSAPLALAACGEPESVPELTYDEVKVARDGGADTYASYVRTISGRKVVWQGRVVEAVRTYGDDYVELGFLYVDMDPPGDAPEADLLFEISPSQIETFTPDQPVTFEGVVRELQRDQGRVLLFLQAKEVE